MTDYRGAAPPEDPPGGRSAPLVLAALALALPLALASAPALAQEGPVAVRSEVDRTEIAIGDQVLLTVLVDLPEGYELVDPGVPRSIGDLEVVEALTVLQTRREGGGTRVQLRYLVTAFELGEKRLPAIAVGYRDADGREGQARTPAEHVIQVRSVVLPGEDTSDIKPLKPPLAVPGDTPALLARLAPAVAAAVALLAATVVLVLRRRRRPLVVADVPPGPARRALDELERIAESRLPEQGRTREHYDRVAAALRLYASERFGLRADARTARELRLELEEAGVGRGQAQMIGEVLRDAEAVRYEDRVIYPARAHKTMRDLLDLMRRSVVAEEYELIRTGGPA